MMNRITITNMYGDHPGDVLTTYVFDKRTWKCILHRVLLMKAPLVRQQFRVISIAGAVGVVEPYVAD
jgi:hypothetical protein